MLCGQITVQSSVPKCPLFRITYTIIKFKFNYESNYLMLQSFYGAPAY